MTSIVCFGGLESCSSLISCINLHVMTRQDLGAAVYLSAICSVQSDAVGGTKPLPPLERFDTDVAADSAMMLLDLLD